MNDVDEGSKFLNLKFENCSLTAPFFVYAGLLTIDHDDWSVANDRSRLQV
jgi:hypothetical protein